jgi:hypothetical protein
VTVKFHTLRSGEVDYGTPGESDPNMVETPEKKEKPQSNYHVLRSGMVDYGGPGSGNFGHAGRPGKVGGSSTGKGGGAGTIVVPSPHPNFMAEVQSEREYTLGRYQDEGVLPSGMSLAELDKEIEFQLLKEVPGAMVVVRVPSSVMDQILESGRVKSQFETQRSGGTLDNKKRALVEEALFNYPEGLPAQSRPIYGSLSTDLKTTDAAMYGNTMLVMKDSVKARTTFTSDDSLDINAKGATCAPSAMLAPKAYSVALTNNRSTRFSGKEEIMRNATVKQADRYNYTEAQIHGGVKVSDIQKVVFEKNTVVTLDTRKLLSDLQIPYEFL